MYRRERERRKEESKTERMDVGMAEGRKETRIYRGSFGDIYLQSYQLTEKRKRESRKDRRKEEKGRKEKIKEGQRNVKGKM